MTLLYIDSFDHFASADIVQKWPLASTGPAPVIQAGGGRRGTNSLRSTSNGIYAARLFTPGATWIVGMSVRFQSAHPNQSPIIDWADGTSVQTQLAVNGVGQVVLYRGVYTSGTVLGTSTVAMGFNTHYYLEWSLTIHASTGASVVRIDGVPVLSLSTINTQAVASGVASRLRVGNLGSIVALGDLDIDDLYVCDQGGSANNAFLGDCRVDYLPPDGDGTHRAWTPSAGTDHYALVDDLTPNADTDYLASGTAGQRDTHTFPSLPSMPNPVVKGVQHVASARKDDAGTRQVKSLVVSGGTTQVGAAVHTLALSYVMYTQLYETDPATGAAWTTTAVNGVEAGVENQ